MTEHHDRARDRGDLADGVHDVRAQLRPDSALIVHALGWAAAYAATLWLGRQTVTTGSGFALFWPASGVALAWIATGTRRLRPYELGLVGALSAGAAYLSDDSGWQIVNALVGPPLGLCVFLVASRRWAPGLWGTGGSDEVGTLRQFGRLLAAAILAGATEAAVAVLLLLPDPGLPFERVGELAITHTIGMATVGVAFLVLGGHVAALPPGGPSAKLAAARERMGARELAMAAAGTAVTALVFLAGFVWYTDAPVSFILLMLVVVFGIRYGAPATGIYGLAVVTAACWLTVAGRGPIAVVPEPHRRALAFGLFALAVVGTGLTIAISRRERDLTIARLRESEHAAEVLATDLSLVLANLEEGVAVVEEGGRFIHANPAIGRLLEMPDFNTRYVEPAESYHLVHPDGRPLLESEMPHVRAFAGEEEVHDVLHLRRDDLPGERIYEVFSRRLPEIRGSDPPRAVTTIRDVTAEHQQRDALTSFAQVVAHDLRNPLTSVGLWAAELMDRCRQGHLDPELGTMMLRHIESSTERMQNFISDLLAYAIARDQALSPVGLELTDVVESVVETVAALDRVQPAVHYEDLPQVWADPVLLPQLFDNLIGNSIKYVEERVVPEVWIDATPLPDGWTLVRVVDNGIGIDPEDRVRVFETFERAHAGDYSGTGLGLAICRHIVERHGGTIGVAPPPEDGGTCIELTLPLTRAAFDNAAG